MSAPLVERNTGDVIPADDHNDVKDYLEDGTYRINTKNLVVTVGDTANVIAASLINNDITNNLNTLTIENATTGCSLYIDQNGAGIALNIDYDGGGSNSVMVIQNDAAHTGKLLNIANAGSGTGLFIDQNSNAIAMTIDSEATTHPAIYIDMNAAEQVISIGDANSSNGSNYFNRNLVAASTAGPIVKVYNANSEDDQACLYLDQAGTGYGQYILNRSVANDALRILNQGIQNGIHVDQDGNGSALYLESAATGDNPSLLVDHLVDNDNSSFRIKHSGTIKFQVTRNDDVTDDVVMKLGAYFLWVDSTGDLRISSTYPTSDTSGTIVGTQS